MIMNYLKEYGPGMLICTGSSRLMRMLKFPQQILFAYDRFKHRRVQAYLYKKYAHMVDKQEKKPYSVHKVAYVFWWQGEENAPELVQTCIRSIRENSGLEVVLITKDNYDQYVELPAYIVDKMQAGKMTLAQFSDILRFNLLYKWGGVWIDATNFLTGQIPEKVFSYPVYSVKRAYAPSYGWKWTCFYICAQKNDYLCGLMVDFFNQYWESHETVITYLLVDCWLSVLYNHNQRVREEIDNIPDDEVDVFAITGIVGQIYSHERYENAKKASYIHKLTYKESYSESINGKLTVWGYIKQRENPDACELENCILR